MPWLPTVARTKSKVQLLRLVFIASNDVLGLDGFCPVLAIVFVCMDPGLPTLLVLLVFLHTSQYAGQQLGANMELGKIGHAGVAGQGSLSSCPPSSGMFQGWRNHESLSVALTVKEAPSLGHCGRGAL